jgi:hypothetical protein
MVEVQLIMTKLAKNTLDNALKALIQIEHGNLPAPAQLKSLQEVVWAWMAKSDDVIPAELHKQGSAINREQTGRFDATKTSLEIFDSIKKNKISKTKAAQLHPDISERTAMTRLKQSPIKNQDDAERHKALQDVVKKALQEKP